MRKIKVVCCLVGLSLVLGLWAFAAPAALPKAKPITLTMVAFLERNSTAMLNALVFKEKVEQRSGGELIIDYRGGPEAIPTFEQPGAVRSGVIDIAFTAANYMTGYAPEFGYCASSVYNPAEEREKGINKIWEKLYKKYLNSFYMGSFHGGEKDEMNFFTNVEIKTPKDFAGLKLRAAPVHFPWTNVLQIKTVSIPTGETYTAMERHVIDGFALPLTTGVITTLKLNEVTKYIIIPGFVHMDQCTLINLDKWNGLPKHLQNLLIDISKELEQWSVSYAEKNRKEEMEKLLKSKMKVIHLLPADAEWWKKSWPAAYLDDMKQKLSPESVRELSVIYAR